VLDDVHKAVDELNNETLPEGTRIHPFMDRTDLVAQDRIFRQYLRVIVPLLAILLGAGILSYTVGKDFLPPLDEGAIWIQVQLPPGISIEKSKEMGAELRKTLKEFKEVSYVMTQVGRDDEGAEAFSLSHVECGVGLKPYSTWKFGKTKADLIEEMAAKLETMPGYSVGFSQPIIDMGMVVSNRFPIRSGELRLASSKRQITS